MRSTAVTMTKRIEKNPSLNFRRNDMFMFPLHKKTSLRPYRDELNPLDYEHILINFHIQSLPGIMRLPCLYRVLGPELHNEMVLLTTKKAPYLLPQGTTEA